MYANDTITTRHPTHHSRLLFQYIAYSICRPLLKELRLSSWSVTTGMDSPVSEKTLFVSIACFTDSHAIGRYLRLVCSLRLAWFACSFWAFMSFPPTLKAGILLDDFVDSQIIQAPDDLSTTLFGDRNGTVGPLTVGDLGASRYLQILGTRADPHATLDSNVTTPGVLTVHTSDVNSKTGTTGDVSLVLQYKALADTTWDITENGESQGLLIDFNSVNAETRPSGLMIYVWQQGSLFYRIIYPFVGELQTLSTGESELFVPFSDFSLRGRPLTAAPFTHVDQFEFYFVNGYEPPTTNPHPWTIAVNSIRIGPAVPEPTTRLFLLTIACFYRKVRSLSCRQHRETGP
ncbi:MAG: hypothetical protein R3E01_28330 [Pirellulaceae bacterium]